MGGGRTPYMTRVEYTCGTAMKLSERDADGKEFLYDKYITDCLWNQTYKGDPFMA